MIYFTKKDRDQTRMLLNHRMIERIESHESTVLYLENGKKYIVDEDPEEIIEKIIAFESKIQLFAAHKKETKSE